MRSFAILIASIILWLNVSSQNAANVEKTKLYLSDQSIKLQPSEIFSSFTKVDFDWLNPLYDDLERTPFESAYNLNVFDYYKLNNKYDSELKREMFKQMQEYGILLDSLNNIKLNYLSSVYYGYAFREFDGGECFDTENGYGEPRYKINYDLKKKGFLISIGIVVPFDCKSSWINHCPKIIYEVEFSQLNVEKKYNRINSDEYTQYIFIPMDVENALEIENNRNDVDILRIFNIIGIQTATYSESSFTQKNSGKAVKVKIVKGGDLRLIIYNRRSNKVYFDRLYRKM